MPKVTQTVVVEFDDIKDPEYLAYAQMVMRLSAVGKNTFIMDGSFKDNEGVEVGQRYRNINDGSVVNILDVCYSAAENTKIAICAQRKSNGFIFVSELVTLPLSDIKDCRQYGKMSTTGYDDA